MKLALTQQMAVNMDFAGVIWPEMILRRSGLETRRSYIECHATMVLAEPLAEQVCEDVGDDVFLACAIAANAKIVHLSCAT